MKLSNSLTEISSNTFYRNESLKQITIPDSIVYIGSDAFGLTGIKKAVLPSNCRYLSSSFPENCIIEGGIKAID